VVLVVLATDVWPSGPQGVSYLYAAVAAGAVAGAFLARPVSDRLNAVTLMARLIFVVGVVDVSIGLSPTLAIGCALLGLAGVCDGLLTVANDTAIMRLVHREFLGRAFSVYGAMYTSCNVFGMLLGGVVKDAIGARAVMVGAGGYMIVLALPALLFARRVASGTVRPSGSASPSPSC